jgi:uncharacterized heparinase superfamily protein
VTGEELALLSRTAVHLRPGQVAHRARLRAQRAALERWPATGRRLVTGTVPHRAPSASAGIQTVRTVPGWPVDYAPLDATALSVTVPRHWPSLADLRSGHIRLLGVRRPLTDWQQADAPQLWRFHLHYWDWAWGLAGEPDRAAARAEFARLWRSWRLACTFGRGDAWRPYPAALRAWSWCGQYGQLVAGSDLDAEFCRELAAHARFLRLHLESDVGGNHLVKDLKALVGLGVFLGDEPLLRRALRQLTGQLPVQVLPDGGHFERAPAYHCQVLADLIDVADLVSTAGHVPPPPLTLAIARMRRWLGRVLAPDGAVPLLNDGFPVPGALAAALRPLPAPRQELVRLADSGLVRAAVEDWHLLADVGAPCPDELPAHAHADTLGCLLHVGGAPLLVDTGTSTYQAGPARQYERSTAAHNTAEIDGRDSTEVWGAFRAGRRARVRAVSARATPDGVTIAAAHDGYRHLPGRPGHRRRWSLGPDGLVVEDCISGRRWHEVIVRWHLPPATEVRLHDKAASVSTAAGEFAVTVGGSVPFYLTVDMAPLAAGFLQTEAAPVLTCRAVAGLPFRLTTSWRRASYRPGDPRRPL